jgi:hypothetical protein
MFTVLSCRLDADVLNIGGNGVLRKIFGSPRQEMSGGWKQS